MTGLEDLFLERLRLCGFAADAQLVPRHDIGNHNRTYDSVLPCLHKGHLHVRMPVDYRLNFLGMDLEAADINDPVPSTGEVIAITTQLDHVASVDKAIFVCEGFARLVA